MLAPFILSVNARISSRSSLVSALILVAVPPHNLSTRVWKFTRATAEQEGNARHPAAGRRFKLKAATVFTARTNAQHVLAPIQDPRQEASDPTISKIPQIPFFFFLFFFFRYLAHMAEHGHNP